MSHPKGSVLPVHEVNCMRCGEALLRATYWRKPMCAACRKKLAADKEATALLRLRHEARRYRILLHHLGWEDEQFEDMLYEIKRSPMAFRRHAESRAARYDLALDRRRSRRTA